MGNGQTREEKIIQETATKETYLECPVLVDLEHGTIRHRHEERITEENSIHDEDAPVKVGYFYHPKLTDFSEDAIMSCGNNNRLKYVFEGPSKDKGKRLFYIYGTNQDDKDKGIHHDEYKPQGKGYNWPNSYRQSNNLYYDVIFINKGSGEGDDAKYIDTFDSDGSLSQTSEIVCDKKNVQEKENIRLKLRSTETVSDVAERVSLQLLIPCSNIHLMWNKNELMKNDLIAELNEEMKERKYFTICLRLT